MSTPRLYIIFEYLLTLITEASENAPFMLTQLQPAIIYKFPDFSFATYELSGLKEFIQAGEKAGYFKLVNTGSMQTAYLVPGAKRPQTQQVSPVASSGVGGDMGANDPRRLRWMTLAMENMLSAERADHIIDTMKGIDALSPEFDSFLAANMRTAPLYPTRGKLKRIRDFLATYRTKGEAQAAASWQVSRSVLRMPVTPPVEGASRAQSLLWALLQGTTTLAQNPVDSFDNFFMAILNFSRQQMTHNKSFDWVVALDMLEAEIRALPRPVAMKKTGLFGGKQAPLPVTPPFDEAQILALTQKFRHAAGVLATQTDNTLIWQSFVQTPSLDMSLKFLAERPKLTEDDRLLPWLEDQISDNVAMLAMDEVRNLANKAAVVLAVRQFGLDGVRQNPGELKSIYESVMDGAKLLGLLFGFLEAPSTADAVRYFEQHTELDDETVGALLEDQLVKAARQNNVARFQTITERTDLWRNLIDFGSEEGSRQHERFKGAGRDGKQVQAEMGLLLLAETTNADEWQDIIASYPAVATQQGLDLATHTLDMLSFQNADTDLYNRHFNVKRLIERCLELGVDRALAELK
ncbi:MAG: hypothetical protein ABI947_27850 [Chloroflexota bacterium]